ncbi:Uncharacterized protein dnm_097420 [Desulfonema magnum]|uniref:Uncharacterized protein n=1 Tax=Desulfonema magnum TaxID=45655 RepID=A0A975BXR7_9BACT|nr:Uncharacterized protein dnm_097420 [Desulfonema magnum]
MICYKYDTLTGLCQIPLNPLSSGKWQRQVLIVKKKSR